MSANTERVQASYDAFHRRDLPGVLAGFAPEVRWIHPDGLSRFGLGGVKTGHEAVVAFIKSSAKYVAQMTLEPHEFIESDQRVIVFGARRVVATNGREAKFRFVHSWTFDGDKAIEFEDYFDTEQFIRLIAGEG